MGAVLRVTAAALLVALVFVLAPRLDIVVARQFVSHGEFWLRADPVARLVNRMIPPLVSMAAGALLVIMALALAGRPVPGCGLRRAGFLALSLIVGPGLIVNALLKAYSGRPRPADTTEFGGAMAFQPAFHFDGACAANCSFVSGDASVGFAFVALALLMPPRHRLAAVLVSMIFGIAIGFVRMAQGAHFLSDIVFAGFFTVLPILVLHHMLIERGGRRRRAMRNEPT